MSDAPAAAPALESESNARISRAMAFATDLEGAYIRFRTERWNRMLASGISEVEAAETFRVGLIELRDRLLKHAVLLEQAASAQDGRAAPNGGALKPGTLAAGQPAGSA